MLSIPKAFLRRAASSSDIPEIAKAGFFPRFLYSVDSKALSRIRPDNNVEVFDGEVMEYLNLEELRERLVDVFEGRNVQYILSNARKYVIRNSASNIANTLMRLAHSVKCTRAQRF